MKKTSIKDIIDNLPTFVMLYVDTYKCAGKRAKFHDVEYGDFSAYPHGTHKRSGTGFVLSTLTVNCGIRSD